MAMTCSCHTSLNKLHQLSIPCVVVILTILVSSIQCVQLLSSWDFAVTHGQQIVLSSMSSGARQVLAIPPPLSSIDEWQNSTITNVGVDNDSRTAKAAELWKRQTFKKLEFDPIRGLFFLISSPWNLQSIVVFNVTSNQTHSLMTKDSNATLGGIVYHNGSIFWTNGTSNSIWKMNTINDITTWTPAKDFYKPANCQISELAIDAKTNTLFFIDSIHDDYKIQYVNLVNHTKSGIVTKSHAELFALTTDDSFLYWVEGSHRFHIQRVPLLNLSSESKEVIQQGKLQLISTLSVACSQKFSTKSLFWSTCNSKTVWQKDNISINSHEVQHQRSKGLHFGSNCPHGIISRSFAFKDWSPCNGNSTFSNESRFASSVTTSSPTLLQDKIKALSTTTASPPRTTTTSKIATFSSSSSTSSTQRTTTTTPPTSTARTTTRSSLTRSPERTTTTTTIVVLPIPHDSSNNTDLVFPSTRQIASPAAAAGSSSSYHFTASTANIVFVVVSSSLLIVIVILIIAVVYLHRKVQRLQQKPRIRRRVIVSRSSRDTSVPSMCELVDIENCCNMNECETPCYERLGSSSASSNSSIQNEYKTKGKSRTEDKERLIDT